MDENDKENNSETDENQNNTLEEEQTLVKENELTHYNCAHCDYTTKIKFDLKRHMRSKLFPNAIKKM